MCPGSYCWIWSINTCNLFISSIYRHQIKLICTDCCSWCCNYSKPFPYLLIQMLPQIYYLDLLFLSYSFLCSDRNLCIFIFNWNYLFPYSIQSFIYIDSWTSNICIHSMGNSRTVFNLLAVLLQKNKIIYWNHRNNISLHIINMPNYLSSSDNVDNMAGSTNCSFVWIIVLILCWYYCTFWNWVTFWSCN